MLPPTSFLSTLFSHHPETKQPILSIPLPASWSPERVTQAVSHLMGTLALPAS
jgi:hypothetical protein